ncbi:MAG TPA: hypothetical protein VMT86_09345 [Bryobacteraceae bacterium]|nr:hypothetical protein [Bryobacteraceae bacterium]
MSKMLWIALLGVLASASLLARDISGNWEFSVDTAAGSGSPSFVFKQDGESLTGTYNGLFGKADVKGTVKGDQVDFQFKFDYSGQSGVAHYTGTIESDTKMKGKVEIGDLAEGTWTATKQ